MSTAAFRKGSLVVVTQGDKHQSGKVTRTFRDENGEKCVEVKTFFWSKIYTFKGDLRLSVGSYSGLDPRLYTRKESTANYLRETALSTLDDIAHCIRTAGDDAIVSKAAAVDEFWLHFLKVHRQSKVKETTHEHQKDHQVDRS